MPGHIPRHMHAGTMHISHPSATPAPHHCHIIATPVPPPRSMARGRARNTIRKENAIDPHYLEMLREHKRQTKAAQPKPQSPVESPVVQCPPPDIEMTSSEDEMEDIDLEELEDVSLDVELPIQDVVQQHDPDHHIQDVVIPMNLEPLKEPQKVVISKERRLFVHIISLLCLFKHARLRNRWTLLSEVSDELRNLVPTVIMQELHPPAHLTGFLKSKKLMDGLRHTLAVFVAKFKVRGVGLYSARWDELHEKSRPIEGKVTQSMFIDMAKSLTGSRDIMAQLLCATLRTCGLVCRLISSLQPIDFSASGTRSPKNKKFVESKYPVYWIEVWDKYEDQWITVDPWFQRVELIRSKSFLEPPATDRHNILRYCIGWSAKGTARDLTMRYSDHYNSRVRKKRIGYAGSLYRQYYDRILARFAAKRLTAQGIAELRQLHKRLENEGIPSSVNDFIGHPLYILEHQLHKNQFLDPKTPCGKLALKNGVCNIYRRSCVKQCHSAQTWYRRGRILIPGAQPRLQRQHKSRATGEMESVGLYSLDQTEEYTPPPVGPDGEIPKSQYRTIDIFTPSMIPQGASHLTEPNVQVAAKILGVDFANAVVGVDFGRSGPTSKYNGIVAASIYREAILTVAEGVDEIKRQEAEQEEELRLLLLWRKYILAIQIWDRVESMNPDPDKPVEPEDEVREPDEDQVWEPDLSEDEVVPALDDNDVDAALSSRVPWEPLDSETEESQRPENELWEPLDSDEAQERQTSENGLWEPLDSETQESQRPENEHWEPLDSDEAQPETDSIDVRETKPEPETDASSSPPKKKKKVTLNFTPAELLGTQPRYQVYSPEVHEAQVRRQVYHDVHEAEVHPQVHPEVPSPEPSDEYPDVFPDEISESDL